MISNNNNNKRKKKIKNRCLFGIYSTRPYCLPAIDSPRFVSSDQIYRWSFLKNKHLHFWVDFSFPFTEFCGLILLQQFYWLPPQLQDRGFGDCIRGASVERSGCILWAWWWRFDCFVSLRHFFFFWQVLFLLSCKQMCWLDWFLDFITISSIHLTTISSLQVFENLRLEGRRSDAPGTFVFCPLWMASK